MRRPLITSLVAVGVFVACAGSNDDAFATPPAADHADNVFACDERGFPERARFTDEESRQGVRNWLYAMALNVLAEPDNPKWHDANRDCAGFIRFCVTEALKRHDASFNRFYGGRLAFHGGRDRRAYYYPDVPVVGKRIWRVRAFEEGALRADAITNAFSVFADAKTLFRYNLVKQGESVESAKKGDVLVFYREEAPDAPYHLMLYLGRHTGKDEGIYVVYHTGDPEKGELRLVTLATLNAHPNPVWHAVAMNRAFVGVYRFWFLA